MNSNILQLKVSDLTVAELLSIIDSHNEELRQPCRKISGIDGLAEYLQCSRRTASRLKASGKIDEAITQVGKTITFDEPKLRKLLQVH